MEITGLYFKFLYNWKDYSFCLFGFVVTVIIFAP